jgi:methionine synthase / methylenetetrahydrofolate reductase(NADPH)
MNEEHNMKLLEFLKDHTVITDGAMGTYFSQMTGKTSGFSETANLETPELVRQIHQDYIDAGAVLIRTNTFSVNTVTLGTTRQQAKRLLHKGYEIAREAVNGKAIYIAASIGPVPDAGRGEMETLDEYKFIADSLLEAGADIFVMETLSSTEYIQELAHYIKTRKPSAFLLTQFATMPDGYTRRGISMDRLIGEVKAIGEIDAYGFNCGAGPAHLYNNLRKVDFTGDLVSVLPNAGYPEIINERTVFTQNPDYFAGKMKEIRELGVKILGGCCGTTPAHIRAIAEKFGHNNAINIAVRSAEAKKAHTAGIVFNEFQHKLKNGKFVVAVELDPPFDANVDKIMQGAQICKRHGVDLITVADSPMARARVDSVMLAAKIKREVGIETMPHICCRDKNLNALKSGLLAGHIEGIRNILAVTGDPIASGDKGEIKSVFNLNSVRLMELISEMNRELFPENEIYTGGALNLNVANKDVELSRMVKKVEKGASFFLTQPVFSKDVIDYLYRMERNPEVKILAGILPLVSYKNAQFLNNEVPGIRIPEEAVNRFHPEMNRAEAETVGIALAVEIAQKLKPHVDGFYFITPFNRVEMIARIIKETV